MSMRGSGGGFVRDGATQTGRALILIVVAIVVAVVLLHHNGSTNASTAAVTSTTASGSGTGSVTTTGAGSGGTTAGPTTTLAPTTTVPPSTVPVHNVKVLVLNGANFNEPFASQTTSKVQQLGYTTLTPNNATAIVKASAIYVITASFKPEAEGLAQKLGLPDSSIHTTVPTGAPLSSAVPASGANLVLVVGPDLVANTSSTTTTPTT